MRVILFEKDGSPIKGGGWYKNGIVWAIVFLIFVSIFRLCVYQVNPNEVGVVQRFGKFVRIEKPGLHFKFPDPIEKVTKVLVDYVFKEEFGFETVSAGVRSSYSMEGKQEESLVLTGDLNVLDITWVVQYKIKDPVAYLFNVRDKRKNLRDISEAIIREVIGDYTFDEVFVKRLEIDNIVKERLQKTLDYYQMGVLITKVLLQDVTPPDRVKPAFNEVNEAKQEKERMINEAWEIYNKKIPLAKGQAEKMIQEAEGYAMEVINKAKGETSRFLAMLKEYNLAPQITKTRMFIETMEEVLKRSGKKYIMDPDQRLLLPFMQVRGKEEGIKGEVR